MEQKKEQQAAAVQTLFEWIVAQFWTGLNCYQLNFSYQDNLNSLNYHLARFVPYLNAALDILNLKPTCSYITCKCSFSL